MVYHCCTRRFSLTHVHLHPDTHTHTQIVTHQSVFTTTPLVKPHATIWYSMTYHGQTHVNHGIPLLYTTVFTHSRSPTSRHTHTYTDSHTPISIHHNTIGQTTCNHMVQHDIPWTNTCKPWYTIVVHDGFHSLTFTYIQTHTHIHRYSHTNQYS